MPFTGRARQVILGLKYRNRRQVARHLAGLLVNRLVDQRVHTRVDVVTWAPTTEAHRRGRGFDQGEIIARTVARQLGLPCRRLLERTGEAASQTGRSRADRLHGPAFRARPNDAGARVLLIDDVVTTGATLLAAEAALVESGSASVVRAAIAATPARRGATVTPIRSKVVSTAA